METHLAGKATGKRQNFDPSTPPACEEHLHFTLNGKTRRAPRATTSNLHPDSLGRHGPQGELSDTQYFQTSLGQISIAPWTDRPPPREKRETE
jgi:hypothetical protein